MWKLLLLTPLHFISLQLIYGDIVLKPEHRIEKEGNTTIFVCSTSVSNKPVEWLFSKAKHAEVEQVYHGGDLKPQFHGKMNVTELVKNGTKTTTLKIRNVTMQDAGTIFCRDDAPFGRTADATLSVTKDIKCTAACSGDLLLVGCSACYWSEKQLQLYLNFTDLIKANSSHEALDQDKNCFQHESVWSLKVSCQLVIKTSIFVMLSENSTNANLSSHSIDILAKSDSSDTSRNATRNDSTENFAKMETTQINEIKCHNENRQLQAIILTPIMMIIFLMLLILYIYVSVRYLQIRNRRHNKSLEPSSKINHCNNNNDGNVSINENNEKPSMLSLPSYPYFPLGEKNKMMI